SDGQNDLKPPRGQIAEQRIAELVRIPHERYGVPRDDRADRRGGRATHDGGDALQRRRQNAVGDLDRDVLVIAACGDRAEQREPEDEDADQRVAPDDTERENVAQQDLRRREEHQRAEAYHEQCVLDAAADAVGALEPGLEAASAQCRGSASRLRLRYSSSSPSIRRKSSASTSARASSRG